MASQDSDKIATDILARLQTQRGVLRGAQALRAATSNPTVVGSADSQIREAQRSISYLEEQLRTLQSRRSSSGATPPSGSGPGRVASPGLQGRPDGPPGSFTSTSSQTSLAGRSYFGDSSASYASSGTSAAPGGRDDRPLPPPPPGGSYDSSSDNLSAGGYGQGGWQPAPIGRMGTSARKNFTNLDLIKYDAPHSTAQISRMLHQLEFKLQIEKQYKMGIDKMAKLYSAEGDRKSKSDAESKRVESASKIVLLQHSLRKYQQLHVIDDAEEDAMPGSLEDRRQKLRKPLSGTLQISVRSARDIEHTPIPRGTRSGRESTVVIKIEDSPRARTHPSRSDRWSEDFEIAADNANEIEVTVYDRIGSAHPVPVGMLWIRISDIVEELRKKKFGQVDGGGLNAAGGGGGWVPAEDVRGQGFGGLGPNGGGDLSYHQTPAGAPASIDPAAEGVEAWFAVEPAGAIALRLNFIKQNVRKHAFDARLGRQGAVRKRKEDVAEINGHKFVSRQFYQIIRCALCGEFLLNAAGSQCEDCRYTCHKKCAQKVVTKCISKSNAEAERDEVKINHRIPHRFEPITNLSANWCCHCGYILPLGRKGARKCSDCDVTCHSDCAHLVPDFCGMSMAMANQLLSDMETIKRVKDSAKTQAIPEGRPAPGTYSGGGYGAVPPVSRIPPPVSGYSNAGPIQQHPDPRLTGLESQTQDMSIRPQEGYMGPPPVHQQQMHPHMQQQQSQPQPGYPQRLPQSQAGPQSMPVKPQGGMDMVPPRPLPQQPLTQGPPRPDLPGPGPHSRIGSSASQGSLGSAAAAGQAMQVQQQQQQQALAQQPPRNPPSSKRKVDLNCFNFLAVLGKGNFGKVMLAEEKRTGNLYAIKVLKKEFIIENDEVESTKSEKRVFLAAARERHPFLLGLHSCFQTETRVYFVMEYVSGGDLMLHIQRKQFTPRRAKFYAAEVLLALEYFHKQGIIYRDLKLDNILLTLDGHVKVADYGLCKEEMWYGNTTSTFCGTPEFMAPEILLEQRYGRAVDWWAFGILIYEMLLGQAPFRGDDEDEIFDAILEDEPLYPISMPRDSVSILQKLLARDPTRRLGSGPNDADDIKAHPFFRDVNWDDMFHKRVPPPFCPTLKSPTDTTWFDTEFTNEKPTLTPVHSVLSAQDQAEFKSFSWTAPNL